MSKKCFKINECTNCIYETCPLLNDLTFSKVISQGVQGTVIAGTFKNQEVAIKIEMLNDYPVTMTSRTNIKCDSFWIKVPGVAQMMKSYLKFQTRNNKSLQPMTDIQFQEESSLATQMGDIGIGPKVFLTGICRKQLKTAVSLSDVGIIVMEKFDCSLKDFILESSEMDLVSFLEILPKIKRIVMDLRSFGKRGSKFVEHGDLHHRNILLTKLPNGFYKVAIIDFGFSKKETNEYNFSVEIEYLIIEDIKANLLTHCLNLDFSKIPDKVVKTLQFIEVM